MPLTTSNRCIWSIVAPPQETCKRPSKKPQLEAPEEDNTHLYIDPLEDLISVTDKTAIPSSEEEEGTEKMLTSPVRTATCKKQTTITGKEDFPSLPKFDSCSRITVRICTHARHPLHHMLPTTTPYFCEYGICESVSGRTSACRSVKSNRAHTVCTVN